MYSAGHLGVAYGGGYAVGTQVSNLIQTYAPDLHMSIGQGIYTIVNSISTTFSAGNIIAGAAQVQCATYFSLGSVATTIANTGGDYGVCSAWFFSTGGGSGGSCSKTGTCPVFEGL